MVESVIRYVAWTWNMASKLGNIERYKSFALQAASSSDLGAVVFFLLQMPTVDDIRCAVKVQNRDVNVIKTDPKRYN